MKPTACRSIRRRPSAWSGLLEKVDRVVTPWFKAAGDVVVLLGRTREELGGSEYFKTIHGLTRGTPPWIDLEVGIGGAKLLSSTRSSRGFCNRPMMFPTAAWPWRLAECCIGGPESLWACASRPMR